MIGGRYGGRILLRCTYMEKGHLHAKGLIDVMIVSCMRCQKATLALVGDKLRWLPL